VRVNATGACIGVINATLPHYPSTILNEEPGIE